ncbi:MAG: NAD+ synthase [Ancalomicrobiaceae bacterium]|nr:NAD+ synthase [Ancalomicrobiaceae bacterium]
MTNHLRIALAQLNPTLGDIAGNLAKARTARAEAAAAGADLIVFSELFICGYPPEDLVLKPAFQLASMRAVEDFAADTADGGPAVIVGAPWREGDLIMNTAAYLAGGRIEAIRAKVDLPNYGPFDEKRVFDSGPLPGPITLKGVRIGVPICEDIWTDEVTECLAETGAEILIVPNGSPYWRDKSDERLQIVVNRVVETRLPILYLNQVGGQDELIFDGASFGVESDSSLAFQLPAFKEAVAILDYVRERGRWTCRHGSVVAVPEGIGSDWEACVLGLKDYVEKNRFPGVVLGLSGGIDSAVVAAMAVDALGPDRVHCVMMPYHYTAGESLADAAELATALGVRYDIVPIAPAIEGFEALLSPLFAGRNADITEENLQSRARGSILMAISNKFGSMVLTTGNKSEMSVGYATLYGDMNGGFNPIKDLYKTQVFAAAKWRNENMPAGGLGPSGKVIPDNIITRPPSAELRPDQKDEDSLPPYPVLDAVLECLVEQEMPISDIIDKGYPAETVKRVEWLLRVAEYKRRQAAPGVKITRKNFGRDRRYPITNGFRDPGVKVVFDDQTRVKKPQEDTIDY